MKRALILLAVVFAAAVGAAVARALQFHGAAKPGVDVVGLDVGGKDRSRIESALRSWGEERVTIRASGRSYHVPRSWLVAIDARATADRVLAAGEWNALVVPERVDVAPVVSRAEGASGVLSEIAKSDRA